VGVYQVIVNISVAPTTAPAFYLARTTARGTQASTLAGQPLDPADAGGVATLDVCGTGASAPTFTAANKLTVGGLAITAGGAFIWTFPGDGLIIPATNNNGIAICNANASGATTGTFLASFLWRER
jgi:hypothetical protein